MSDFTALQEHGPLAPVDQADDALARYLDHYGLSSLLSEPLTLHAGFVETQGFRLWTQVWTPTDPIGTIVVVHGYYDHLGLYRHLLESLLERHWRIVLWDLPGHGLSSGARASIGDFDEYGACLAALRRDLEARELAAPPWVGIGQSTGAAILATDALTHDDAEHWQGLVLLAPLVRPYGWSQANWLQRLVGPFVRTVPRRFRDNSTDSDFATFLRESDPLQPDRLAMQWVNAMRRWMPRLIALPPSRMPTLILQGEQDSTVDWPFNLGVLKRKFPNAEICRYPDARHHLVNESEPIRRTLFSDLARFLADLEEGFEALPPEGSEPA